MQNGCGPITETILITEPPEITLFGTAYDNSCFNASDGSIDLVTTGNNLIFNWTGPSLFSSTLEDISWFNIWNLYCNHYRFKFLCRSFCFLLCK